MIHIEIESDAGTTEQIIPLEEKGCAHDSLEIFDANSDYNPIFVSISKGDKNGNNQ